MRAGGTLSLYDGVAEVLQSTRRDSARVVRWSEQRRGDQLARVLDGTNATQLPARDIEDHTRSGAE